MQEGDIVIVGSDGLFDNLFDVEIMEIVRDHREGSSMNLAEVLAQKAFHKSESGSYLSMHFLMDSV